MKVLIVGGGIGGTALALSLHQAGIDARIFEAAKTIAPLGVGINLQPGAVRELDELGLSAKLAEMAIPTLHFSLFNKFGQPVWSEPRGVAAGYKWPQYSIHRGQLQVLLFQAAKARIGSENVLSGHRLIAFREESGKIVATFADSDGHEIGQEDGDILVGADGIHSTVRAAFYPNEGLPHFNKQLLWRAACDWEPFLGGHTMAIAGHLHKRVIAYPIARSQTSPGKLLTNWIVQMTVGEEAPPREDWNRQVSSARALEAIKGWKFPWLDFPAMIESTAEIFEFPLVDRDPVAQWSFGRVTLMGDAAHPMQPTGSQAGSQAILDARILTQCLMTHRDPTEALAHFDATRRPAMSEVTLRNRKLGPEWAMQLAEERAPNGFENIEDVIPRAELETISRSFQAIAGLDAATVNTRPPFVTGR